MKTMAIEMVRTMPGRVLLFQNRAAMARSGAIAVVKDYAEAFQ